MLKYSWLGDFDKDMIKLTKENRIFDQRMGDLRLMKDPEQTIVFYRNGLLFAFNFSPDQSLTNVLVPIPNNADYEVVLCSDDGKYGGYNQVEHMTYPSKKFDGQNYVELYIPARTAIVLKEGKIKPEPVELTVTKKKTSKKSGKKAGKKNVPK